MIGDNFINYIYKRYFNHAVVILTLFLVSLMVFIAYNIYDVTLEEAKRLHQRQQLELAKSAANGVQYYLDHLVTDIQLASFVLTKDRDLDYFYERHIKRGIVKTIFKIDRSGAAELIHGEPLPDWAAGMNLKLIAELSGAETKYECVYSEVIPFSRGAGDDSLYFIMLIKNPESAPSAADFTGYLISFDRLMDQFIVPLRLSESDFAWILDNSGRLIYHPNHKEMLFRSIKENDIECSECHSSFEVQENMLIRKSAVDEYIIGNEPPKIMAYYPIQLTNTEWTLAISTYLPAIIESVRNNFILVFVSSALAIIVILGFGSAFYIINLRRVKAEEAERYLEQTRNFQEKLNHAAKLASIGELVDSVAHEINTPTGIISAEADALMLQHQDSKALHEELKIIKDQTRRIGSYTKSLLSYSRRMPFQPKMNNIIELIDECIFLLSPKIRGKKIKIVKYIEEDIQPFIFDRGRLEQVIVNILNNAIDFVGADPLIKISLSRKSNVNTSDQEEIELIITDNGEGIPEGNLESIFEPFFSTKPLSGGTGLGLSISKAIVTRHKGRIEVESEPGEGTSFKVYLPLKLNG